ncbi:MAG TPA: hypothetical protein EYG57_19970 [Planctomycetes bacterium]|nr:hypothetical protein [Planctomycetota bacterium]
MRLSFQLALVALLAIFAVCIWLGIRAQATSRDKGIVDQLTAEGVSCKFHRGRVTQVSISGRMFSETSLDLLLQLPTLTRVVAIDSPVHDQTLVSLAKIEKLRELVLIDTQITDAGLAILSGLPNIEYLHLSGCPVTNEGLRHVAKLTSLTRLDLESIQVTDDGLRHLNTLHQLRDIYLAELELSRIGLDTLQRDLPKTDIFFNLQRQ